MSQPQSIPTRFWAAVACLAIGMLFMSPAAGFLCYLVSSILAAWSACGVSKMKRLAALVLLGVALLLALGSYPGFQSEMQRYRARGVEKSGR